MENKSTSSAVITAFDTAIETVMAPLEEALGVYAVPCRKAGEKLGEAISHGIDKVFDKIFD